MPPETREDPGGQAGVQVSSSGEALFSSSILPPIPDKFRPIKPVYGIKADPNLFYASALQEMFNQAEVGFWLRRATEWGRIDPFVALQCRRKAWVLAEYADDEISPEVWDALADVTR